MLHQQALNIARKYYNDLAPLCVKIKVAGSLRRYKPEVKDIEIVCIPDENKIIEFIQYVENLKKVKGEPGGKYTQRLLPEGIALDLFMADENNYGLMVMIRTGSWEFSKRMMWECKTNGFYVKDGYLHNSDTNLIISVKEEADFFEICNIKYVEPKLRIK